MGSNENPAPHHETPTLGNPDLPQEGRANIIGDPASAKMTGPQNKVIESQFPNQMAAPGTDISTQPFFWSSFNISPMRQQRGGWARSSRTRFRDFRRDRRGEHVPRAGRHS